MLSILFLAFITVLILALVGFVPALVPLVVALAWVAVACVRLLLA